MKIGLVGAGAIAEHHLEVLGEQPGVVVAAVCDIDDARANAVARRTGARAFSEWEAMLAAEQLDALFVCTPPPIHAAPTVAALQRKLPVYLEKPLARSLAEGRAINRAWQESGTVCAIGYQWRSLDVLDELQAMLRVTAPGLLVSRSYGPTESARRDLEGRAGWFGDPGTSGGVLFELASHDIDLQIALAGSVESVQATAGSGLLALADDPATALDDRSPCCCASRAAASAGSTCLEPGRRPRRSTHSTCTRRRGAALTLDPVFELRGRADGEDVSIDGAVPPRVSSVSVSSPPSQRRSGRRSLQPRGALETLPPCSRASGRPSSADQRPHAATCRRRFVRQSFPGISGRPPVASVSTLQNLPVVCRSRGRRPCGGDVQRRAVEDAVGRALVRGRSPRAPRPRARAP